MKIYLARHGEYRNPNSVVPYRLPGFPLSELGRTQAQLIADKLIDQKIRAIYTSPVERCQETASIIGQTLKLASNPTEALTELGSPLQGITIVERDKQIGNFPYDLRTHIDGGGETEEMIFARMSSFIEKLKLMSKNSSYLIVSHGDPIKLYLNGVMKKEIRYIPMGGLVSLDFSQKGIPKYQEII